MLVYFSGSRDNTVSVWNLETYAKKKTIPVYEVGCVDYSNNIVSSIHLLVLINIHPCNAFPLKLSQLSGFNG